MVHTARLTLGRVAGVGALAAASLLATAHTAHAQEQQGSVRALGIDTTGFDRAIRPQDDFFRFVNGTWLANTEIPADASSWGSFNVLSENSRTAIHEILEDAVKAPAGAEKAKLGAIYSSFMDSARIEQLGITPLAGELATIGKLQTTAQLPATFAHFARIGVSNPASAGVGQDPKASNVNIVQVRQSGLGLPDRDYYLRNDATMVGYRAAYVKYITDVLTAASQPDPAGSASRIMALETSLANIQWSRTQNRDRNATYNKMTVAQLAAMTPAYNWNEYLKQAGLTKATEVIVGQPSYLQALNAVYANTPVSTWREYLTFKLLDAYATELPSAFVNAAFDFKGKTLSGQQEMSARWKRAVSLTQGIMGEGIGRIYVEQHFTPQAKARMDALVHNLLAAYKVGIDSLDWMSPETKKQAQAKLAQFTVKIGYPDKWRDYSALTIKQGDALGNSMRSAEFGYADMVSRLNKPVDRGRWSMTPQTVNAYYNATNNEIVFPAAILQPPFFNPDADDAVNYGAIGAVIGHEIGHGFDDQGSKSDGMGNLRDWWTPADAAAFKVKTDKLAAQYDAINPIDTLHINGHLTMGENIGDVSGLQQAYRAYRISLHGKEAPVIDGFTGDQRFFLGFAQIWREKMRDAALRQQLLTDPHSPGMARAFVPLTDNDAFMKAFNVQPGDKMWRDPADRVKIW